MSLPNMILLLKRVSSTLFHLYQDVKVPVIKTLKIPLLSAEYVKIKDVDHLSKTLDELRNGGSEKLQVITDFDATVTKHHVNGQRTHSSFGILTICKSIPQSFIEKNLSLGAKYYPIERNPKLSKEEKTPFMIEWYSESQKIFNGLELISSELEEAVKSPLSQLRDGSVKLFQTLSDHDVPTLVLSAGLGNVIRTICASNGLVETDKFHIISNFFKTDGSVIKGFGCNESSDFIHPFNKNGFGCGDYFKKLEVRNNVILMGDTVGDSNMAEGVPQVKNVLKIGFLYGTPEHVEESMEDFLNHFDIILIDDQTMNIPQAILNFVFQSCKLHSY